MPALMRTNHAGRVLWLGRVPPGGARIEAHAVDALKLDFDGAEGERHSGSTRPSCARVTQQHPRGTVIRNTRQLALVAVEELAEIARRMGLPRILPEWLGASIVVEGLPDFSHLPPSSRLQGPDGVTLVVDMQNRPCSLPAQVIEEHHAGFGARFKSASLGLRGVTAWIERPGTLALNQALRLHVPDQRVWRHLDAARGVDSLQGQFAGF